MAIHYKCCNETIEQVLQKMKKDKRINQEATFDNTTDLRKEVSYRDIDFLEYLGFINEEKIVDDALKLLIDNKHVSLNSYDKHAFMKQRMFVKRNFKKEWTTISPVFERMLYMLTSVQRPKKMLGVGIFWGNGFVWSIGSSCGEGKVYQAEKAVGLDLNPDAISDAKSNFSSFSKDLDIRLITQDGVKYSEEVNEKFDFVFLDVGITQIEKSLNYPILLNLYDKLV